MRYVRALLATIGLVFVIFACFSCVAGFTGGYTRFDVDLPKISIEKPGYSEAADRREPVVTQQVERAQSVVSPMGVGTITIGSEIISVPAQTRKFTKEDFPALFEVTGQKVVVVGPVAVQADDQIHVWDGTHWQYLTQNVGDTRMLPEGEYYMRVWNFEGDSYFRLLERDPD